METSSKSTSGRGLWNNPRVTQYSKESQERLRLMKEESRLTNLQRKQNNQSPKNGSFLHLTSDPTPSPPTSKSVLKRPVYVSRRRSAEACRSGSSYERETFRPGPTRDLEKEKRRLQNILATGKEELPAVSPACQSTEVSEERERYQEVLDEIDERRQFLADMASLGQERQYIDIINTEISQKIRELKLLEKACCLKEDAVRAEQTTENAAAKRTDCCH